MVVCNLFIKRKSVSNYSTLITAREAEGLGELRVQGYGGMSDQVDRSVKKPRGGLLSYNPNKKYKRGNKNLSCVRLDDICPRSCSQQSTSCSVAGLKYCPRNWSGGGASKPSKIAQFLANSLSGSPELEGKPIVQRAPVTLLFSCRNRRLELTCKLLSCQLTFKPLEGIKGEKVSLVLPTCELGN